MGVHNRAQIGKYYFSNWTIFAERPREREGVLLRIGRIASVLMAVAVLDAAVPAAAQENLDAGKTPPQLFRSDCSVCHDSPRGLAKGTSAHSLTSFLRQHYTSSQETASALARYLVSGAGAGERQPVTASRSQPQSRPLPRARVAPPEDRRAKPTTDEPRKPSEPSRDTAKPDKKPPKKDAATIEQAAKPAEPSAQGDRSEGEDKAATSSPATTGQQLTAVAPDQQRPVATFPSGASIGESTGGPLRNAVPPGSAALDPPPAPRLANSTIPLAGRLPSVRPPPPRLDNIAD